MSYYDWDPKRGAPSNVFGSWFDVFIDANRIGVADGATVAALADSSGNGRSLGLATSGNPVYHDPSSVFPGNGELVAAGVFASFVGQALTDADPAIVSVSAAIAAIVPAGGPTREFTLVWVGKTVGDPWMAPVNGSGAPDAAGYRFGQTGGGKWATGTTNNPVDSGVATDANPHMFIAEYGTATSGLEIDGVLSATVDLSAAACHIPKLLVWANTGSVLFAGVLAGLLSIHQKKVIRKWVAESVPTITVTQ